MDICKLILSQAAEIKITQMEYNEQKQMILISKRSHQSATAIIKYKIIVFKRSTKSNQNQIPIQNMHILINFKK